VSEDRTYIADNARELERMRRLVDRLSADDLQQQVNESWTVAGVLGHIAFWDGRAIALADKLERGLDSGSQQLFSSGDDEPGEVDWINDATRPLIHAVDPEQLARLTLDIAEETDARVAKLPLEHMWPSDSTSPLNAFRSSHRAEHLDEIEASLAH
jgi:DinB superfamily